IRNEPSHSQHHHDGHYQQADDDHYGHYQQTNDDLYGHDNNNHQSKRRKVSNDVVDLTGGQIIKSEPLPALALAAALAPALAPVPATPVDSAVEMPVDSAVEMRERMASAAEARQ
ncbi:hypothetical protein B484DRAFT_439676, partial [Ochromonadaceae sp. CCMP2298]